MANADRPLGAIPVKGICAPNAYQAGGSIKQGDFVMKKNDGTVVVATATSALIGVAAANASSGQDVLVYDNPEQRFKIQSDSADIDAQTDILLNYDIVATAADSTFNVSRHELDGDSGATTATLPLKLLAVEDRPDNELASANVDCIVKINNHQLGSHTGTAGV